MIDYTTYKKIYTDGSLFTLTGADFSGYAQLKDGVATEVSTGKTLSPKSTYATDLFYTTYFQDRVIADSPNILPNKESDCLFSLNDNFNFDLFKFKLDKLRENNTFAYSRMFISSNKLPATDTITYASAPNTYSTGFEINVSDQNNPRFKSNVKFADNNFLSAFGYIVDATAQVDYDDSNNFSLFCCTSSNLISLTGSSTSIKIIEDSTGYETEENDLAFAELGGLASTNKFLYVSDTGNNTVLKYDIEGYQNNDSALKNKRNYIELVGGFGDGKRQTKFLRPTKLAAYDDKVAVLDSGNFCVKLFDSDFNFTSRITSIDLRTETFGGMAFDPDFGTFYVVTYKDVTTDNITNRTAFLYRFSGDSFKDKEKVTLKDKLGDEEVVNDVTFSGTDSNFWYFSTNLTVYKKFKTRPEEVIGKFRSERLYLLRPSEDAFTNNRWNFTNANFADANFFWNLNSSGSSTTVDGLLDYNINNFNIFPTQDGTDRAIMLTDGRLYFFNEPTHTAYQRVLKDENYANYGSAAFSLNTDSFIQQSVVNTELFKVVNDTLTLKNNIIGRFTGKYVDDVLELDDYDYNVEFDKFLIQELENLYVHGNEENLTGVLNRCFALVYELQDRLMNFVQPGVGSKVQPSYTSAGIIEI
jgi:hypothetical protein